MISKVPFREPQIFLDKLKLGFSILFEKYFFKLKIIVRVPCFHGRCLIYKVLFAPCHQAVFRGRSLECLYIIPKPIPFVNTFFHFFCDFFQVLLSVFASLLFCMIFPQNHYFLLKNGRFAALFHASVSANGHFFNIHFQKTCEKSFDFCSRLLGERSLNTLSLLHKSA